MKRILFYIIAIQMIFLLLTSQATAQGKSGSKQKAQGADNRASSNSKAKETRRASSGHYNDKAQIIDKRIKNKDDVRIENKVEANTDIQTKKENKGKALGKNHQQQLKAFEKQRTHEEAKYLKRLARLERIRSLANKEGNQKVLSRVDKATAKLQEMHKRKMTRLAENKLRIKTNSGSDNNLVEKSEISAKAKIQDDTSDEGENNN